MKVISILLLLFSCVLHAQGEKVKILERKTGKRIVLLAENLTEKSQNIFLMVHAEGYRRSADKPVLMDIPPKSTKPVITLIELANAPSSYTYDLIVNDVKKTLELEHEKEIIDIENAIKDKLVVFTINKCKKCTVLLKTLNENRIEHRDFNIATQPGLYAQFMSFIDKELTEETKIRFPVIWDRDHTVFGYDDLELVVETLRVNN